MEVLREFLVSHDALDEYCKHVLHQNVDFRGMPSSALLSGTFGWVNREGVSWSHMAGVWQDISKKLPAVVSYETAEDFINALRKTKSKKQKLLDSMKYFK